MSETTFWKRNWKLVVNIATFAALLILVYAIRHQLVDTFSNINHLKYWFLVLIVPLEAAGYHAQTKLYQSLFRTMGTRLRYKPLYKVALELNFVNHVFPSGGVSGISYFGLRLKSLGARGTHATLVQTMRLVMQFLSFEVLLFAGMLLLAISGQANNLVIFIGTIIAVGVLVATGLFVYVIGSRARINLFFGWLTKLLNRVIHYVRPHHPETINVQTARRVFDEFHDGYLVMASKRHELKAPFWWGLVYNVTEVLVVYVCYAAFGEWVNLGAIILAFAVANFAGMISVLPGGIGIYEGLMTAVLATAGIPPSLSLPVTITYRVLNTLVQIPPGYYLYHRALHAGTINKEQLQDAA